MAFEQSIPLCLFYSYISGLLDVLATSAAAYPGYAEKHGKKWPKQPWVPMAATVANIGLRLIGMLGTTIATFYGPVSIATPTSQAAILVSNMIIFGAIMKAEKFTKPIRLGTYIIALAAILLPVVGADLQQNEHILKNLSYPGAATLSAILVASMCVTSYLIFQPSFVDQRGTNYAFYVILSAQVIPTVVGATLTKMFVLVHGVPLYIAIGGAIFCLVIILYSTLLQATYVKQAKFVPLETSLTIGLNEIAGFLLWHDFLVVQSWLGYACVSLLFILGSYSLGSIEDDMDLSFHGTHGVLDHADRMTMNGGHNENGNNGHSNAVLMDITKLMEMEKPLLEDA